MVAYSFNNRFCEAIANGSKRQTIRSDFGKRHVRVNELIQFYTAMRTKQCRKIIADAPCIEVIQIKIKVAQKKIVKIKLWGSTYWVEGDGKNWLDVFARADGFQDIADMHQFWFDNHGMGTFNGVLIKW